jgi:ATP-dependent Clp protease ATP-binding subunit ClpA
MFERFTDRARKIMALANQEALRMNHEYIGTEHILLGLVKEGSGVGANALKNLDVNFQKIGFEVVKLVGIRPDLITADKLPQTPRVKAALQYAIEEARKLNHNYIGSEHLLLGLFREQDGVAAQVFRNLGIKLDDVRKEIRDLLGNDHPETPAVITVDPEPQLALSPAVVLAIREARGENRLWNHKFVGSGQILIGLLKQEGTLGAKILQNLGLTVDQVRGELSKSPDPSQPDSES